MPSPRLWGASCCLLGLQTRRGSHSGRNRSGLRPRGQNARHSPCLLPPEGSPGLRAAPPDTAPDPDPDPDLHLCYTPSARSYDLSPPALGPGPSASPAPSVSTRHTQLCLAGLYPLRHPSGLCVAPASGPHRPPTCRTFPGTPACPAHLAWPGGAQHAARPRENEGQEESPQRLRCLPPSTRHPPTPCPHPQGSRPGA